MAESTLAPVNGASAKPAPADDARAATVAPRVDVLETAEDYLLLADMPGVRPDDVDVRFENGELTVHGRRSAGRDAAVGYFRTFRVTDQVAADKITANLKNGLLTLKLPKVEAVKPRRIAVSG